METTYTAFADHKHLLHTHSDLATLLAAVQANLASPGNAADPGAPSWAYSPGRSRCYRAIGIGSTNNTEEPPPLSAAW